MHKYFDLLVVDQHTGARFTLSVFSGSVHAAMDQARRLDYRVLQAL